MNAFEPPTIHDEAQLARYWRRSWWMYGIGCALCAVARRFPFFLIGFGSGALAVGGGAGLRMSRLYERLLRAPVGELGV